MSNFKKELKNKMKEQETKEKSDLRKTNMIKKYINLPVHEIKAILRVKYPTIKNEEIEELICKMNKERSRQNYKNMNQQNTKNIDEER